VAEHHERAIAAFAAAATARGARGVVIVGSVARGTERPDSDVDLYEVVEDDAFAAALSAGALARVEHDAADWPGGYLDIKLVSPALLARAVTDADDATRASFVGARVVLDREGGLAETVLTITRPPAEHFAQRIASFAAQFALHADYFLVHGRDHHDPVLAANAAVHAGFAAGRMALAAERVLFRGPKYLTAQLREAGREELADAIAALVDERGVEAVERVRTLVPELAARAGDISDEDLALFIADNEWAWFTGQTPPEHR
jgi:hypothetical protein